MNRHVDLLPLGSVVRIKGTKDEDYAIVQRCVHIKPKGKDFQLYDYGCVFYPEGLVGRDLYYFNSYAIGEVLFKGYSDDDDKKFLKGINKYLSENDDYSLSLWDKISSVWETWG